MTCSFILLLTTPQLNFIFQIDSVFMLDALSNLFCKGQSVGSLNIVTLGNDEVRMLRGNYRAPAARTFHPQIIDHLAGTNRAGRRILEEASGRARAMRLRRHTLALGCFHP